MKNKQPAEQEIFPRKLFDSVRVGVVYPQPYRVGMSNLGFQWALRRIEQTAGFAGERFFIGASDRGSLVSMESKCPAADCHVLAFSISYETDYLAVLRFLLQAGIPPLSRQRSREFPLVVAGGAALQVNPEPLAPFVDIAICGEGEGPLDRFLQAYLTAKDRQDLLRTLEGVPGFYIPAVMEVTYDSVGGISQMQRTELGLPPGRGECPPVTVATVSATELFQKEPPFTNILTGASEFPDTLLIEIGRGCPSGCRYCWAGYRYRPLRAVSADNILALARIARPLVGKVGLVSTAVCQHPELMQLLKALLKEEYAIGFSSLRLPDITPPVLELLAAAGEDSVTLAPETGSFALRRRINKGFTNEEVLETCQRVFATGISKIKVYFMAGLPDETEQDIAQSVGLVKRINLLLRDAQTSWRRPGRLTVGISPFVPKPNTPFQFAAIAPVVELKNKIRYFAHELHALPGVEVRTGSVREAFLQWRLAMGTRQTGLALLAMVAGEMTEKAFLSAVDGWQGGAEAANGRGNPPPWGVLDWGIAPEFLREEWHRAMAGKLTSPCPSAEGCQRCGICGRQTIH